MTLKCSVRLRLHIFRVLKCSQAGGSGAAHAHRCDTCGLCRTRRPTLPQSRRLGSPLEVPFPNPHCPCLAHPQIPSPRQVLSLSSGESVLESFNCLSHHGGNFCGKKNKAIVSDPWQFRHTMPAVYNPPESHHSWFSTTRKMDASSSC